MEALVGQKKYKKKKKLGQQIMPHAKEIFPQAILGTRTRGSRSLT